MLSNLALRGKLQCFEIDEECEQVVKAEREAEKLR